jgi:polysaccharide biosynthesis transport protein
MDQKLSGSEFHDLGKRSGRHTRAARNDQTFDYYNADNHYYQAGNPRDLRRLLLNVARWRKKEVLFTAVGAVALAACASLFLPNQYTGRASLLIETRRSPATSSNDKSAEQPVDSAILDTQMEIVKSDHTAKAVLDKLNLWNDSQFNPAPIAKPGANQKPTGTLETAVVVAFKKQLAVVRYGRGYIAEVSFSARDPQTAAAVANAFAEAYIDDIFAAKSVAAQRTGQWLIERMASLRDKAASAARDVEEFKSRNNLMVDATGRLTSEHELQELSISLARARADSAQSGARLERTRAVQEGGIEALTVIGTATKTFVIPDEISSPLISRLRQQYLDLARQRANDATETLSSNIQSELNKLTQSIGQEVDRIASAYRSEVEIAQAREKAIEQQMANVFQTSAKSRQNLTKLHELEAEAQSYKLLHESALARYIQTTDQQTYPVTEARLVSPAGVPATRSSPRTGLMLALAAFAGGLVGLGLALQRETSRPVVRDPTDVETATGIESLGHLPVMPWWLRIAKQWQLDPLLITDRFDILRSVRLCIDAACADGQRVIGITSAGAGAGKTTVAYNLAVVLAEDGYRVLLIDGDFRSMALTKAMRSDLDAIGYVIRGEKALTDAVTHTKRGFDFIGGINGTQVAHPSLIFRDNVFKQALSTSVDLYDYVIVDLPDAIFHVDIRSSADFFNGIIMIAEWGRTSSTLLTQAINRTITCTIGVLVNKTPQGRLVPRQR